MGRRVRDTRIYLIFMCVNKFNSYLFDFISCFAELRNAAQAQKRVFVGASETEIEKRH